jgi:circadian clock protein KaiC
LHFLAAGARERERGLYFSFFESPERVVAKSERIGLGLTSLVKRGDIEIQWQPLTDLLIDELAEQVLTLVQRRQVRRLVIDGLGGFKETAVYPERILRFFAAFANELRALGVTTLLIEESRQLFGAEVEIPVSGLSAIFENVIFLRQVELGSKLRRLISIIKTHDGAHETELREFFISKKGLTLASTFGSAESVLSGLAHQAPGSAPQRSQGASRSAKPRKDEPSPAKPKRNTKPKPKPGTRRKR